MARFKKGNIIIGAEDNGYSITSSTALMIVLKKHLDGTMEVLPLAHVGRNIASDRDKTYPVENSDEKFYHITIEEYFARFNEVYTQDYDKMCRILSSYGLDLQIADQVVSGQFIGSSTENVEPYELSDEKRKELISEMTDLLTEYGYNPTEKGLNAIIDEWAKNKAPLIRLFENHPNYNGRFQIVFDMDYDRQIDYNAIYNFSEYAREYLYNHRESILQKVHNVFTLSEIKYYYSKYRKLAILITDYAECIDSINGMSREKLIAEKNKWNDKWQEYEVKYYDYNGETYTRNSFMLYENLMSVFDCFSYYSQSTLDEDFARNLNEKLPKLKAVAGQKTSRVMQKICKMIGLHTDTEFNKQFAKYADAINPLSIKRHTIISCHPVDYFTMANGNSWTTCQRLDKKNQRGTSDSYTGESSSGTLSYMLDGTTFIFYTVDKEYNGNMYELQDKVNRNLFHYGHNILVQGRVYPQSNDGENGIYQTIREITQQVIAECITDGVNAWMNVKGTDECYSVIISKGTHYYDYTHFNSCNVSYYNKEKTMKKMIVGHNPICPNCGIVHDRRDNIECYQCNS